MSDSTTPTSAPGNGVASAVSLVLGVIAAAIAPAVGVLGSPSLVLGVIAIICGCIGAARAKRRNDRGLWMAVLGIVFGTLAAATAVGYFITTR